MFLKIQSKQKEQSKKCEYLSILWAEAEVSKSECCERIVELSSARSVSVCLLRAVLLAKKLLSYVVIKLLIIDNLLLYLLWFLYANTSKTVVRNGWMAHVCGNKKEEKKYVLSGARCVRCVSSDTNTHTGRRWRAHRTSQLCILFSSSSSSLSFSSQRSVNFNAKGTNK